MVHLEVNLDAEGAWADLFGSELQEATNVRVGALRQATVRGNPVVAIRLDFEEGPSAVAMTTLKLFLTAADTLKAGLGAREERSNGR